MFAVSTEGVSTLNFSHSNCGCVSAHSLCPKSAATDWQCCASFAVVMRDAPLPVAVNTFCLHGCYNTNHQLLLLSCK